MHRTTWLGREILAINPALDLLLRVDDAEASSVLPEGVHALLVIESEVLRGVWSQVLPRVIANRTVRHVLLLANRKDARTLQAFRAAGIASMVDCKDGKPWELRESLDAVVNGRPYLSETFGRMSSPAGYTSPHLFLSPREELVFSVVGAGLDDQDAANLLRMNRKTVSNHRYSIMRKLGLHQRGELIQAGLLHGYVVALPSGAMVPGFIPSARRSP